MSNARDEILQRVRTALGRERLTAEVRSGLERRIAEPPACPRPGLGGDPVAVFRSALESVHARFTRTRGADLMDAIASCLDRDGRGRSMVAAPALQELPWPADWHVSFGPTRGEDRVSITPCFAAVAETGSGVLLAGPQSPTSLNFLPESHIVLVREDQLLDHTEDVWPRLRQHGAMPRAVNFITGPSKTADVEQTIQYGAHGPRSLDVVLTDSITGLTS